MKLPVVEPWYAQGLRFSCTQCGNCCTGPPGYVWISDVEIERLATHLNMPIADVLKKYCRKIGGRVSLKERISPKGEYDCVFLKEIEQGGQTRRVCTVYEVRPLQCRTWPFWDGLLESEEAWLSAGERCPGMNMGKKYTREQIEALRDAEDWPQER